MIVPNVIPSLPRRMIIFIANRGLKAPATLTPSLRDEPQALPLGNLAAKELI